MGQATNRASSHGAACDGRLAIDDAFDTAFAGQLARMESYNKHHYRPNSYLHKWWARRCGSTFRLILKHLVTKEASQDYYAPGGLEGKVVLDPMMGGVTTLHEAIRMGANVVGMDVDPIPVLQARATLTRVSPETLDRAFQELFRGLQDIVAPFWQTHCPDCQSGAALRFMLYGARRMCKCGPVILVDSLVLRYEQKRPAIRLCPSCHRVTEAGEHCHCNAEGARVAKPPLVEKQQTVCGRCKEPFETNVDVPFYARYAPLVVVGRCEEHGLFFVSPGRHDLQNLAHANAQRSQVEGELGVGFEVESGPKARDLLRRGIHDYRDLFSSRQLLLMYHATRLLQPFEEMVRLKLALMLSTSLEFNVMLCGYKGARRGDRPGAIRHAFAHHGYAFPYTALENNALFEAKASGTLQKLYHDRLRRAQKWARQPRERRLDVDGAPSGRRFVPVREERDEGVEVQSATELRTMTSAFMVRQGSAARIPLPNGCVDFVVTDPPYYDNVQYSDLAAFFRAWLPRLVPDGQAETWHYDLSQTAVDSFQNGNGQYGRVMGEIFAECRRVMKPGGRLIFTFHHWKPQGWAALTTALQGAGFALVNRYVVHSENPISVHVANLRAITDDAILVLAPAEVGLQRSWERPGRIDQSASNQFCRDCADLLGWLLAQKFSPKTVNRIWRTALRDGGRVVAEGDN